MTGVSEVPQEGITRRWIGLVGRRWPVGLLVFTVVAGLSAAILILSRPVWRAEARLRLSDPPPSAGASPASGVLSLLRPGGDPFANDLELLGSRTVAEDVAAALALDTRLEAPRDWYRDSLFLSLESMRQTDEAVFEVTWEATDRVRVDRVAPDPEAGVTGGPVGVPLHFGGLAIVARARRDQAPSSVRLRTEPYAEAVERFRSALTFDRSRREANVLDVSYDHGDPGVAVGATAAALSRFEQLRTRLYARESSMTVDSLRTVADQTAAELERAEQALEALQRRTGLVAPDVQAEAYVGTWAEASADLETSRVELALMERALEQMASASTRSEGWAALVAHPRFLENLTVGAMLESLTALEQERMGLATRRSEESLDYGVLADQIRLLDESLRSIADGYARALREVVAAGSAREDSLRALLDGMPAAAIEVGRRQRDVRILTEVLVVTEQRLRQEEIRRALAVANVQVVDRPALAARPVWPRKKLGAAVGILLAFGSAVLSMVVVERADGRVRDGGRIRLLTGAPMLAALVFGKSGVRLTPDEVAALGQVPARSGLALCALESLEDARAIEAAMESADSAIETRSFGPVRGRPEALRVVRDGPTSIVLIVRSGTTSGDRLAQTTRRFAEVGGHILGTVLLCRTEAEGRTAWS